MKRLLVSMLILLSGAAALAASATDEAFTNLADEYISDLASFSRVGATLIGDHSADHELDQVDDAARAEVLSLLQDYRTALQRIDPDDLSAANQIDADLLLHEIEQSIWEIEELQEGLAVLTEILTLRSSPRASTASSTACGL